MPDTFHSFPDLPPEIRLTIWELSFSPRAVEVHAVDGQKLWRSSGGRNPVALHVCRESRKTALKFYSSIKNYPLYFNWDYDTVVVLRKQSAEQLQNLVDDLQPRRIGLSIAHLEPPLLWETLPRSKSNIPLDVVFFPDAESPKNFLGDIELHCNDMVDLASSVADTNDQLRIVRLKFISRDSQAIKDNTLSNVESHRTEEMIVRFGKREMTTCRQDLLECFNLVASLSSLFGQRAQAPPLLELCFPETNRSHSKGVVQVISSHIESSAIKTLMDAWTLHLLTTNDKGFQYTVRNNQLTIKQVGADGHRSISNITTGPGESYFSMYGGISLDEIEIAQSHAQRQRNLSGGSFQFLSLGSMSRSIEKVLIQHTNASNLSVLQAIRQGSKDLLVQLLTEGADPNVEDRYGFATTQAIRGNHEQLAILLLEKGADPNVEDRYGFALTQATRRGYEQLAILLLEKGADPNVEDRYGFALTQATRGGYEQLAILLLEKGADPNVEDRYGFALTQATRGGHEQLAILLLEKGADPNVEDRYGFALTQATRRGYEQLAILLLEKGADPTYTS